MSERPDLPRPLKRALLEEAGYRCAIPACRSSDATDFAHIEPWAKTQDDSFENLIVLCANDHRRYDRGEIQRLSIYAYKQNLAVINGRYNDFEQRVLERFHEQGLDTAIELDYSTNTELSMRNLVRDGIVSVSTPAQHQVVTNGGHTTFYAVGQNSTFPGNGQRRGGYDSYQLTAAGKNLVGRWFAAELINDGKDPEPEVVVIEISPDSGDAIIQPS